MSVNFAWFSGGNKNSTGGNKRDLSWGNYLEIPDTIEISNKLGDILPTSRVFTNASVTRSGRRVRLNGKGLIPNDVEIPSDAYLISKFQYEDNWMVYFDIPTGWTSGNSLVELDLKTLSKNTVEVFSVHDVSIRRKINLKLFNFLVIN